LTEKGYTQKLKVVKEESEVDKTNQKVNILSFLND
jgi:hypothetical protein